MPRDSRISVEEYHQMVKQNQPHVLIDVRTEPEMEICSLNGSINVPFEEMQTKASIEKIRSAINGHINSNRESSKSTGDMDPVQIVLVCRRGNDSQVAAILLKEQLSENPNTKTISTQQIDKELLIQDIAGGLHTWAKRIDPDFPIY